MINLHQNAVGHPQEEDGGGVIHSNQEGLKNILRSYLSLVLGHGGGARLALDSSLAVCRYFSFFS